MNKQHKAISKLTGAFDKFIDALDELVHVIDTKDYMRLCIATSEVDCVMDKIVEKYRVKYAK